MFWIWLTGLVHAEEEPTDGGTIIVEDTAPQTSASTELVIDDSIPNTATIAELLQRQSSVLVRDMGGVGTRIPPSPFGGLHPSEPDPVERGSTEPRRQQQRQPARHPLAHVGIDDRLSLAQPTSPDVVYHWWCTGHANLRQRYKVYTHGHRLLEQRLATWIHAFYTG